MKPSIPYDLLGSPGPAAPTFSERTVKLPSAAVIPVQRTTYPLTVLYPVFIRTTSGEISTTPVLLALA
jgi:hypothetical protein